MQHGSEFAIQAYLPPNVDYEAIGSQDF